MAEEISNRTLAVLLIVAIALSLGGTLVSLNRISLVKGPSVTGLASTETGTATVNITSTASLIFTTTTIAFGNGWVNGSDSDGDFCMMSAVAAGTGIISAACEEWTAGKAALVLENNGNVNVSVDVQVNATGAEFLGSGGILQIMVDEAEANSCGTAGSELNTSLDDEWFTIATADADTGVCEEMRAVGTDSLYINLRINISSTSDMVGRGTSTALITAEGTTV